MKKQRLLFACLSILLSAIFTGCLFLFDPNFNFTETINTTDASDDKCNYYKVTSSKMPFTLNKGDEVYLFTYNAGEKTISSRSYKGFYQGAQNPRTAANSENAIPELNDDIDYSNYTCGFSSECVRDSYDFATSLLQNQASRAASSTEYNKSKYKRASRIDDIANFYVVIDNKYKEIENAKCVATNDICQVFVESSCYSTATNALYKETNSGKILITKKGAEAVAKKFQAIYGPEQALSGAANLAGNNFIDIIETSEKITILIADLGTSKSGTTLGYFSPSDLLCSCNDAGRLYNTNGSLSNYYTNQRLMLTINTYTFGKSFGENTVYSTLAHEFNHLINYINKAIKHKNSIDVWITEMLSAITEDYAPTYLGIDNTVREQRIPYFLMMPYSGFVNWEGDKTTSGDTNKDVLFSYGFAYVFGSYLIRNYGGAKFIKELATNEYFGKDAITNALKSCGYDETYDTVMLKFGMVLANADNSNESAPSLLKKPLKEYEYEYNEKKYKYDFTPINLYEYDTGITTEDENCSVYDHWQKHIKLGSDGKEHIFGPLFFSTKYMASNIFAGGFYSTYLGSSENGGDYILNFADPSSFKNIQEYIYIKKQNKSL